MSTLGPKLARTPLHLFWLLDTSGSMAVDGKIDALNDAVRAAIPALCDAVVENPGVQLLVRAVAFDHDARWHVAEPTDIEDLDWADLSVTPKGTTELGRALALVTDAVGELRQGGRGLPPAMILVSDGKPTDLAQPTVGAALRALADEPWAAKASRMAVGIGSDADLGALRRFIGHEEIEPLMAGNAAELTHYLRWASTVVVDDLSRSGGVLTAPPERAEENEEAVEAAPDVAPAADRWPEGPPIDLAPPDLAGEPDGPPVDLPPPDESARVALLPPPVPQSDDDLTTW